MPLDLLRICIVGSVHSRAADWPTGIQVLFSARPRAERVSDPLSIPSDPIESTGFRGGPRWHGCSYFAAFFGSKASVAFLFTPTFALQYVFVRSFMRLGNNGELFRVEPQPPTACGEGRRPRERR